jgi:hypothetical protein
LKSSNILIELTAEEQDQLVEYDLDEEDEAFLQRINSQKKILLDSRLEFMIDRFEKEASRLVCDVDI